MLKLVAATVLLCALGVALVGRGGDRGDAEGCLEDEGAVVTQSDFFRRAVGDHPLARLADDHVVDVRLDGESAIVFFADDEETALDVMRVASLINLYAPERLGNIVVGWNEYPLEAAAATVRGCLD
ncbi:MAG: hypothetical protein ICV64_03025 [Thermoleophilia bacterium]|nr:hypothetical protein [Thermoleophilia bacterium]